MGEPLSLFCPFLVIIVLSFSDQGVAKAKADHIVISGGDGGTGRGGGGGGGVSG